MGLKLSRLFVALLLVLLLEALDGNKNFYVKFQNICHISVIFYYDSISCIDLPDFGSRGGM